jgi:mono/diheme cytochrome c family protein
MTARLVPSSIGIGVAAVMLAASLAATAAPRHASYTVAQAERGRFAYIHDCAECHGGELEGQFGPALAGPNGAIQFHSGQSVYAFISTQMPSGNAGALPTSEYLDIVAYIYQRSHVPAGDRPLTLSSVARDTAPVGK